MGDWIAVVDGKVVAQGATLEEAEERAAAAGHEDFVVEKVSRPGGFVL